ncbi:MAG: ATP-binding protein, partial [Planctomycetes bacterium]|nr:ATP-binding protein [Planctomycetota bacterium]
VQEDVGLPILVESARAGEWDLFPEYEFRGNKKNAAFKHCASRGEGGLGWVVGIGINNEDISVTIEELSRLLISATLLVLLIVVLWTLLIARRTTQPILDLEQGTRRVAAGDLDARIKVSGKDELAELARAFNQMTEDLQSSREQLVRAEKEAAWREMAQQIAHEIKNPLTPILLSTKLLRRARDERSPELDEILTRTLELVERQVGNMREIAKDFADFAGARALAPEWISVDQLIKDVLELEAAWAEELNVEVVREGEGGELMVDPDRLHRVLINLISNALEAMGAGGTLLLRVERSEEEVSIEVLDEGSGLDETAIAHLFEPHFTTKSHGTGLGLAICKRVVDEMGGRIELGPRHEGVGTRAHVVLPIGEAPS